MDSIEKIVMEKSRTFAMRRMKKLHSSHGWNHVERVINIADKITENEPGADHFIVLVSAILHDIARPEEDRSNGKKCHASLGSKIALDFLLDLGLDRNRSEHISECILTHRFRNNNKPESLEAKILYDSDKIDSIGAVGIGRAFLFSGEIGARLHNSKIDIESTEAYTDEDTAYREFMVKLRKVKDTMLTAEGKRMAGERHSFMELFFDRFHNEVKGLF